MSKITVIQGSLNKDSKTAVIVDEVLQILSERDINHSVIDLRKIKLEFCDGRKIEEYNDDLKNAYELMKSASGYIIGMPVYCYSVSGVLKNFLDITCSSMEGKFAGIICNAGGIMSYLASAELMKILSYEVHVLTVQPTVYAWSSDFENGKIGNQKVINKAKDMVENLMSLV
jgi:NAD(P)H-dependent FMN reductase